MHCFFLNRIQIFNRANDPPTISTTDYTDVWVFLKLVSDSLFGNNQKQNVTATQFPFDNNQDNMSINFFVDTQELESCIVSLFYCYFSAWYHTELSSSYMCTVFRRLRVGRWWNIEEKKKRSIDNQKMTSLFWINIEPTKYLTCGLFLQKKESNWKWNYWENVF